MNSEVLLVLSSRAGRDFIRPFSGVGPVDCAEAVEGREVVATAGVGAGDKTTHGEEVDEGVVELLIVEGTLGADVPFATDRLRRDAPGGGFGFEKLIVFGSTQRRSAAAFLIKVSA